jgi:hypothetical protein
MSDQKTIVLVLKSGGDFSFRDVELISYHIYNKWEGEIKPRIICLYDKASQEYDLGNLKIIPLKTDLPGTWSRTILYSPEMEQYKPFLYVDLDTAIIESIESIFNLIKDESKFICLEDFWQKGSLATGLVWFPKDCKGTHNVWKYFQTAKFVGNRMDYFLRKAIKPEIYWQQLTNRIYDFKPKRNALLSTLPENADIVCFHGKPRIFETDVQWVKQYINWDKVYKKVTVIIPFDKDRGWLKDAMNSVPLGVQLILSQGEGNWPQNFNKVLSFATGDYIKYLHEDDMLTENCIFDSVKALEDQGADFIHGNAYEMYNGTNKLVEWKPQIQIPNLQDLLKKNTIHSTTTMYRKEVFQKIGGFNESSKVKSFEEYEFNLRVLKAGFKIGYCDSFLATYRRHPNQIIRTVDQTERNKNRAEMLNQFNN